MISELNLETSLSSLGQTEKLHALLGLIAKYKSVMHFPLPLSVVLVAPGIWLACEQGVSPADAEHPYDAAAAPCVLTTVQ